MSSRFQDREIDANTLRTKYARERELRINPRKNDQYVEVAGVFSRYAEDPYIESPLIREPIDETIDALVIGGGFGGLLAAATLKKAGIDNIKVIEKAGDFGGVWYWNRYPGAQCDIESYIYMPLLEETGYIPSEKYAHAPELFEHARRIGRHFGLYERALFQTLVSDMTWDEDARRWIVTTDRGDRLKARFVFTASGPLNRPKLPSVAGIDRFRGHTFHTSRWDYDYTAGDSGGCLTGLADKRVALIGTGATAVQCTPYLARDAKHLYVVQRTPVNVGERGNRPTDPEWSNSLEAGWQRNRMENFSFWVSGIKADRDLVQDGWTSLFYGVLAGWMPEDARNLAPEEAMRLAELADFRRGEELRARVAATVKQPEVAEGLKAWYGILCKRPTFNDEFLPAFNRDNVTLIDTCGAGLDKITESGLVFDGVEYPVDCIIYATGFEVGTDYSRRAGFVVRGVGGVTLSQHFADGVRSFHGFYVHGFPNLFFLGMGQNAVKPNFTDMLAEQAEHVVGIIAGARRMGATRIEATAEAESAWLQTLVEKSQPLRSLLVKCTPSYLNGEGDIDRSWVANTYGGGPIEFSVVLEKWRQAGDHDGLLID
ncbi:NAD(P)/FAD-dependent oxidoreductase (plasmid) [Agrobacterium leguminum]|uniref:flavin-containing monooxygenase n=1 Tax=Agrobacterium leguminum TaxID=2792015 RepID=UPI0030D24C38